MWRGYLSGLVLLAVVVLQANAKIGFFWHITDIHYDAHFSINGDTRKGCWRHEYESMSTRKPAGRFGDYNCDTPWELLESATRAMKTRQGDNIEFVLWTGDALSHASKRLSEAHQLSLLRNVTDLLQRTFSSQFVFPALGHDDPASRKHLGELWRRWLPPDTMNTFDKGGYYLIEQKSRKLQIVVLNTNLFVGSSRTAETEEDARRQWEWLDIVLSKCQNNKETVYLVGHMPPGADERQRGALPPPQTAYSDHHNRRYLHIIRKYSDIISGQFFGHLHSDSFRIIYNNEQGKPISLAFLSPALTPRRTSDGPNNPGLRLYKFDSDTGQILDYTQLYLDLSSANSVGEAEWQVEYNFSSYYGHNQPAITPLSLHNLADKMTLSNVNENMAFSRYYVANSVRMYGSPAQGGCDASCAHTHYCAITRLDYREYRHCLETAASALASSASLVTLSGTCTILLIAIIALT